MITQSEDVQSIKEGASKRTLINRGNYDWILLYNQDHMAAYYRVKADALHKSDVDAMSLIGFIEKRDEDIIASANCVFTLSIVDPDDWTATLIGTYNGVPDGSGTKHTVDVPYTDIIPYEFDGEPVFLLETAIDHYDQTLYNRRYVHNMGIFDTVERMRRRINTNEVLTGDPNSVIVRIS